MTKVIFGKKIGMVTTYVGEKAVGATQVSILPMTVSQVKTTEKDGYAALQVAFSSSKKRSVTKREIPFTEALAVGAVISSADVLVAGTPVSVQGVSKGKGLAGVVKLHHFAGGPKTHGQSDRLRRPGSIGQGTTPGRVLKGKKMAGRMGRDTVTVKHTYIVSVADNIALVAGPVPGSRGSLVRLEVQSQEKVAA